MAHLLATNPTTSSPSLKLFFCSESSISVSLRNAGCYYSPNRKRHRFTMCSTSSSAVYGELQIEKINDKEEDGEYEEEEEEGRRRRIGSVMDEEIESLVCENGWIVRRLVEKDEEIRNAANVQAEAFHVPVSLFNPLFFQFFQVQYCFSLFST